MEDEMTSFVVFEVAVDVEVVMVPLLIVTVVVVVETPYGLFTVVCLYFVSVFVYTGFTVLYLVDFDVLVQAARSQVRSFHCSIDIHHQQLTVVSRRLGGGIATRVLVGHGRIACIAVLCQRLAGEECYESSVDAV